MAKATPTVDRTVTPEDLQFLEDLRAIAASIATQARDQAPAEAEAFIERRIAEVGGAIAGSKGHPRFARSLMVWLQDHVRQKRRELIEPVRRA